MITKPERTQSNVHQTKDKHRPPPKKKKKKKKKKQWEVHKRIDQQRALLDNVSCIANFYIAGDDKKEGYTAEAGCLA